ncbi:MAG: alpha/beta hydrolase [Deltaproteobacteria bacterium]|nr:alpha/beta hydrolase [Deltaproteobacteria bacterium]
MLLSLLKFVLVSFALLAVLVYFAQTSLIYFPQSYEYPPERYFRQPLEKLEFDTSSGRQVSFYMPRGTGMGIPPTVIWVFFNGNAARALDWPQEIADRAPEGTALLFVDYPGYGLSEGKVSRAAIREVLEKLPEALLKAHPEAKEAFEQRMGVVGNSIGAAVALELAAKYPAQKIVLIAPFTSMRDMVKTTQYAIFHWLLTERFDNTERLKEIFARAERPQVFIYHGTRDDVIPYSMSKSLKAAFPELVHEEVANGTHQLLDNVSAKIVSVMK